jgi:hypothetical protein
MRNQTAFKENDDYQYYKGDNGEWIECSENTISSLWSAWRKADNAKPKYYDDEGYLIFDFIKE